MGKFKLRIVGDLGFEVWQDIEGFEGIYQASTYGNIKSLERKVWNGRGYYTFKEGQKKLCPHKWGYYQIKLSINNRDTMHLVHRLVAETFIPNFNNCPELDHIDGNPVNNRVENLKWVTHKENMNNPITKDKISRGIKKIYKPLKFKALW